MTVRHAVLPIGAVLVLGLGVYLFVEVRAQPAPPPPTLPTLPTLSDRSARPAQPAPPPRSPAAAPQTAALPTPRAPAIAVPAPIRTPAMREPTGGAVQELDALSGPKLDAVMDEANKAYDRGELEDAKQIAGRLLAKFPTNVRMLRIMVSASCIDGDNPVAQAHYMKLPPGDQEQMKIRCARYGITFPDRP